MMASTSRIFLSYASRLASTSSSTSSTPSCSSSFGGARRFASSSSPSRPASETRPARQRPPPPPSKSSKVHTTSTLNPREQAHGSSSTSKSAQPAAATATATSHPRDRLNFTDHAPIDKDSTKEEEAEPLQPSATLFPSLSSSLSSTSSSSNSAPPPPPPPPPSGSTEMVQTFPPPPEHQPLPLPRIPFSTHRFVRQLEHAQVDRGLAEELMKATRNLLWVHEDRAMSDLVGRQELENEAYLFTAALQELKTGSQIKSRNDGIALRSMTAVLQRETDAISQKLKEDIQRLQSDIQLDMNSRKEDTSQELKQLDINIMDLNSKFTILLGEVRTEIEATKWISTRRVMTAITLIVVSVIAYVSSGSAATSEKKEIPPPPSIEELGLARGGEEAEVTPPGGWSFWGSGPRDAATTVKRVGEESGEGSP